MLNCPIPKSDYDKILLGHGSGGVLMAQLIEKIFVAAFSNEALNKAHDGSVFDLVGGRVATTTDAYVIHPLFFPGGDIGSLAVHGTVNDLVMCGARPRYLTAAFILEEGLPIEELWRIVQSMKCAAEEAGVVIISGDTKVVDKGKGDRVFITTTGFGVIEHDQVIEPASVCEGDAIILSGDIGRHGIAIMQEREGLSFESKVKSDSAALDKMILALFEKNIKIHCMRDLTRGGLASTLNEIAGKRNISMTIYEEAIDVDDTVRGACEVLGLDPLYVANEGRCIIILPHEEAEKALGVLREFDLGENAQCIGIVGVDGEDRVVLENELGTTRIVDMISGEQLPRIC